MRTGSRPLIASARWLGAHPVAFDVAFAALVGALTLLGYVTATPAGSELGQDVLGGALIVVQAVSFAFRRVRPLMSFAVTIAASMTFWVADYPTNFEAFSLLAVYSAVVHGGSDRRRVWRVVGSGVVVITAVVVAGVISPTEDLSLAALVGITTIHVTAAVIGEVVHDRRRRLAELELRAERAEAERELLARQAVLDERTRIARDLHDAVAHGVSVMVVQAGAAERLVGNDDDRARQALRNVQAAGREALSEMRRMLGVLRDDGTEAVLAPQPTLDDLAGIVQHCIDAGVPTELIVEGERSRVTPGADTTGFRVVQEALTNVIKHAGRPVRSAVHVTYLPEAISVEVVDDGAGATTAQLAATTGHGLIGMRERVELYGGRLRVGPRPGGGFRVAATIPVAADAAEVR